MDTALIYSWTRAQPGREATALEVLVEGRVFWGKLAADGRCSEPEYLMGMNHNMLMVKGDWDFLFRTLQTDEAITLMDKASFCAEDFTYHLYSIAEKADHLIGLYATAGTELGYL